MSSENVSVSRAAANTSVTAGGAGDNTAVTGTIIDRDAIYSPQKVTLAINWTATLAASKLLTLKSVLIESSDASDMSGATTLVNWEDATGTAIATDSGSGSTLTGCKKYGAHLGPAKRYVRIKFTPDLNATSTDTAALSATLIFDAMYKGPAL